VMRLSALWLPGRWTDSPRMAALLQELLGAAVSRLEPVSDTPQLDAQVLLAHVLGRSRTWILAHPETPADGALTGAVHALLDRLENGEPLPYALGRQEFFGLEFDLTSDVLIPRPETELLVRRAIDVLESAPKRRRMADIGTGCGCIAICVARWISDLRVMATDISEAALRVARSNSRKQHVAEQIEFLHCDILPSLDQYHHRRSRLDLISANLPYIPSAELRGLPVYAREPRIALDGGSDGLDPFRRLFARAPDWLADGGLMLLEIEAKSGPSVLSLAYDTFQAATIHLHKDLAGRDRLLEVQLNGGT
jgi:release factor glutamine methyltransferase